MNLPELASKHRKVMYRSFPMAELLQTMAQVINDEEASFDEEDESAYLGHDLDETRFRQPGKFFEYGVVIATFVYKQLNPSLEYQNFATHIESKRRLYLPPEYESQDDRGQPLYDLHYLSRFFIDTGQAYLDRQPDEMAHLIDLCTLFGDAHQEQYYFRPGFGFGLKISVAVHTERHQKLVEQSARQITRSTDWSQLDKIANGDQ